MFSGYVDCIDMLHAGKRAFTTIPAKGGLNIVLNSRSGFFKISIEMHLIELMTSIRAIGDLNNVLQGHTMLNKIGDSVRKVRATRKAVIRIANESHPIHSGCSYSGMRRW